MLPWTQATANVDHDTDAMIQLTLREAFPNVTIVTIAHRYVTTTGGHYTGSARQCHLHPHVP